MSEVERKNIDSVLAFHGAPTLLGVKCANLISFDRNECTMSEYLDEFADKLSDCGLCAKHLCKCRERSLFSDIFNECINPKTSMLRIKTLEMLMMLSEQKTVSREEQELIFKVGDFICRNISDHYTMTELK